MIKIKMMKNKNYKLCFVPIIILLLLYIPGFSQLKYRTIDTDTQTEKYEIINITGFEYGSTKEAFKVFCDVSILKTVILTPSELELYIYGLEDYKKGKIFLKIYLTKTIDEKLFKDGIAGIDVRIMGRNIHASIYSEKDKEKTNDIIEVNEKIIKIYLNKKKIFQLQPKKQLDKDISSRKNFVITIDNFEQVKPYVKEGKIIFYDKNKDPIKGTGTGPIVDSNLTVPGDAVKIEFSDTILAGKTFPIELEDKKLTIPVITKYFIPVDSQFNVPLEGVKFYLNFKNKDDITAFSEKGTFLGSQENQWIKVNYPADTTYQIVLRLEKEGYQVWKEDISGSSYKKVPDSNIIGLKKILKRFAFNIKNGSGARVTIDDGELSKNADTEGKVWFDIAPSKAMGFTITKKGFKELHGTITPDHILYEIILEPITPPKNVTYIPISNEAHYIGHAILTDNLDSIYTIPITKPETQIPIEGRYITSARLDPGPKEHGKTYRIYINLAGNGCKIIPIEEEILDFQFSLKTCGERRPGQIKIYIDGPLDKYGDPVQQAFIIFDIDPKKDDFQNSQAIFIDPRKPVITAYLMDALGKKIVCPVDTNNIFQVNINLCKPALAVVVFITNSRYALQKQDKIDQAIRPTFGLKSKFKDIYIGWVSYKKTDFQLNELKNSNEQQIHISDVNNNDTADVSLNKIIDYVKKKFTSINANKGQKSTVGRLVVILDKTATYLDRQDYSTQDIKVQLIDINDIISSPNGKFLNLIKED